MYYKTASSAVDAARENIEFRGYKVCEDDWRTKIAHGGRYNRLRPSTGEYHSFTISLFKNDKPQRKCLHITLYGMASGNFELVSYLN